MGPRARRILAVVAVAVALVAAVVGGTAWYLLGEQQRAGRLLAALVTNRTGLPISIERAALQGSHLRLRGVRVPASARVPFDLWAPEVDVSGWVRPLVAPAGHHVSVVALAVSVSLPPGGGAPSAAALETVRHALRALLDWPALLSLRIEGSHLERGGHTYRFELTADKAMTELTLALTLAPPTGPTALRLAARGVAAGDTDIRLTVDLTAEPQRLSPLWPSTVLTPVALAVRGDLAVRPGGQTTADGRLTVGGPAAPTVVDFATRYEAAALVVSRYALQSGPGVRLEGDGAIRAQGGGLSARATVRGSVDGSRLHGSATWEASSGRLAGELNVADIDGHRAARRLGLEPPPILVKAATLVGRFSGEFGGPEPRGSIDVTLGGVATPALTGLVSDATLTAGFRLATDESRLGTLDNATLTLARQGRTLAAVTASSGPGGLWPIAIVARFDDLASLGSVLPLTPSLTGSVRVTGALTQLPMPAFRGLLEADVESARVVSGTPATMSSARAAIPVVWGVPPPERPGSVSVARVTAWGLVLEHLTSTAWLTDGQLLLPDIRYVHYGGEGSGWLEAQLGQGLAQLRLRLEGKDVDLERLSRETGSDMARITGAARYVANAQYTPANGLVAAARLDSEKDGGEVSLGAIQRLLDSPAVQTDSNAMLQQTLRNLHTFRYETLESELRYSGGAGRIDLSLRGKKRLGVFSAPVEAINIRNVPLAVLARVFTKESQP